MGACSSGQLGDGAGTDCRSDPYRIDTNVVSAAVLFNHSAYLKESVSSIYAPRQTVGAKWDAVLGWIDDTYYPWAWSYNWGTWYYVYSGTDANPDGYWLFYFSADSTDHGWGYVAPNGWWCIKSDYSNCWRKPGQKLP